MTGIELGVMSLTIGREIGKHRSAIMEEKKLGDAVATALASLNLKFDREVRITPKDRLDFLLTETGVAIELKKKKAGMDTYRQVGRYLEQPGIAGCIIVAMRVDAVTPMLNDKPISRIELWKYALG